MRSVIILLLLIGGWAFAQSETYLKTCDWTQIQNDTSLYNEDVHTLMVIYFELAESEAFEFVAQRMNKNYTVSGLKRKSDGSLLGIFVYDEEGNVVEMQKFSAAISGDTFNKLRKAAILHGLNPKSLGLSILFVENNRGNWYEVVGTDQEKVTWTFYFSTEISFLEKVKLN